MMDDSFSVEDNLSTLEKTTKGLEHFGRLREKLETKPNGCRNALSVATRTGIQFLRSTTLHGYKYFRDPHVAERLFWLMVHSVNACCASVLCAVLWQRFMQNPSVLVVQPSPARTRTEPYPALTVCPPIRILPAAADRFVAKLSIPPGLEVPYLVRILPQLAALFAPALIPRQQQDLFMLDLILSINNLTYREALDELTPTCEELLFRCSWQGDLVPCSNLFRRVIARSGICCGFNQPSALVGDRTAFAKASMWTTDEQKSKDAMMASTIGLNLVLNISAYAVINPTVDCAKFKMEDITMNSRKSDEMIMPPGSEYWAGAVRLRVDSNAAAGDGNELALVKCDSSRAANPYRRISCLMECVVRLMVARCGCVGPTYPRTPGYQPCAPSRLPCLVAINDHTVMSEGSCDCLPPCDETRIFTEVESMPLSALKFTFDSFYRGMHERNIVLRTYIANHRHRHYSIDPIVSSLTLLSSLGGVFNMFLGVGIISLLEVLFFMAVRLPLNALRAHRARRVKPVRATHK